MKPLHPLTIVVDFDETLISYNEETGFYPLPGAAEAMRDIRLMGHKIVIYTCRFALAKKEGKLREEIRFVTQILMNFGIEFDELHLEDKPIADYYIDDRAIAFSGDWEEAKSKILRNK